MYTVSLLPLEYRNYQLMSKRNNRLFLIILIAAVTLAVVLVTSLAISSVYTDQLKRIESDNAGIKEQINAFKPVEELKTQVTEMVANISQTAGLSPEWEDLISEIGNAIPPTISLDTISAGYSADKNAIIIKGSAPRFDDFSSMLENLSEIEGLGELKFQYSSSDPAKPDALLFQIDIQSLPAKPYELNLGGVQS